MNYIDYIIIGIIVLTIIICTWKGFFISFFGAIGRLLSFVVAFFTCRPFSSLISRWTTWDNKLSARILSWLTQKSGNFNINLVGLDAESLNSQINTTLSSDGFPKILKWLFKDILNITPEAISSHSTITLGEIISETLTIFVFIAASFILIFIFVKLILWILKKFIKIRKEKNPSFNKGDKVAGLVFGILKGVFNICVIFCLIYFFRKVSFFEDLIKTIDNSIIGSILKRFCFKLMDNYFDLSSIITSIKSVI